MEEPSSLVILGQHIRKEGITSVTPIERISIADFTETNAPIYLTAYKFHAVVDGYDFKFEHKHFDILTNARNSLSDVVEENNASI